MIKLEKDLTEIPISLIPEFNDLFVNLAKPPLNSRTTHQKRMAVINLSSFIDTYKDRYKLSDVRSGLMKIYKSKCAFCEQKVEQYHVEHYRPKTSYYWLAFSWDNLMLSCPICNQNKGINFDLEGTMVVFYINELNLRNINNSSASYDLLELPKMVNPEITDPSGKIKFDMNGLIESDDLRFAYTINKCKIDRKELNDKRRTLLNTFGDHIRAALIDNFKPEDQKIAIDTIIKNFIIDSKNTNMDFLAFRRYAISSGWLNQITKGMN